MNEARRRTGAALLAASFLVPALWLPTRAWGDDFRDSLRVEPGGRLEIRLDSGSLEIESHDEEVVRVDAHGGGGWGGSLRFELSGDGVDATLTGKRRGWSWGGWEVRVQVQIPERYSLDVRTGGGAVEMEDIGGDVRARTSGGAIDIDGADGDADVETSGGAIRIEDVTGHVRARTSGGPVRIADVDGGIDARTSGGSIQAHDVGSPVLARTSGGSISVRFNADCEGDLETSGGSIEAELPEDVGVDLDARTSGGRVRIGEDLAFRGSIEQSHVVGSLNGGGPPLRLRTSGGNVRVRVH